jgi:hypothetical protein
LASVVIFVRAKLLRLADWEHIEFPRLDAVRETTRMASLLNALFGGHTLETARVEDSLTSAPKLQFGSQS